MKKILFIAVLLLLSVIGYGQTIDGKVKLRQVEPIEVTIDSTATTYGITVNDARITFLKGGSGTGYNDSTVVLTGTTPTWNVTDAPNAILTLTGTTTITFNNMIHGWGMIQVTNATPAYDITFAGAGLTIDFSDVIHKTGETVVTSGLVKKDRYYWSYNGYIVMITGVLDSK